MKGQRKVRCACCGVMGIHEGRGLIKGCYERARNRGLLRAYPRRQPKPIIRKARKPQTGIRDKHLRAVWNALYANPSASMREIEVQAGCALSTVQKAIRELCKMGLLDKEPKCSRAWRITGIAHADHAYRVVWFDPS